MTRSRPVPTVQQLINLANRAEDHGGLTAAEASRLRRGIGYLAAGQATTRRSAAEARLALVRRLVGLARLRGSRAVALTELNIALTAPADTLRETA